MNPPPFTHQPSFKLLRRGIAEETAPLTIVTGSGLSTAANLPDWKKLRTLLQNELDELEYANTQAGINSDRGLFDAAHSTDDYWLFFKLAKKALTPATFREKIRELLAPNDLEVPEGYSTLMKLAPKGVVTLNLDRLSALAVAAAYPGQPVAQIIGSEIARKWSSIAEESKFLVYLHGSVEDSSTWVLDQDELSQLTSHQGHSHFLTTLYLNHIVLFVGVSADDIALSAPLIRLTNSGFEARRIFWFTNRTDEKSSKWAEQNQVQIIRYSADTVQAHTDAISDLVSSISNYKSVDETRPAPDKRNLKSFSSVKSIADDPEEIAILSPEQVRKTLSTILVRELSDLSGDALYSKFMDFVDKYDFPIQTRAFYRSKKSPNNVFFDYALGDPPMGTGNFGTVYPATSPMGEIVAVKIMHNNILQSEEMLGGFRRGSASMKILSDYKVEGVAKFIESYEMPPTIVMEFVPGNSIQELFDGISKFPWIEKIKIVSDIADIVDKCHKLPAFVLHRDIKPSNIMISDLDYFDYSFGKVTVLDFDMSWHKGSSEKDVVFESRDDFAYLAPEQTDASKIAKSRSTKVDSYGLGMTTFAVFGAAHPIPNMPLDPKWSDYALRAAKTGYRGLWAHAPIRLARFIVDATKIEQSERLEFSSAKRRLNKLSDITRQEGQIAAIDSAAEELLCRVSEGLRYSWDDISDRGSVEFAGGTGISIGVNLNTLEIDIRIDYNDRGARAYNNRNALIGECRSYLQTSFKGEGFRGNAVSVNHGQLTFVVAVKIPSTLENIKFLADEILKAVRILQKIS